ncbi:pentapeptide repeat-containing protein [Micromonospora chersina]|uniref:pentapeptide repeat-containing protein n=1 Tax=Micromonospora chersina TaxID=47854 RepID=UPI0033D54F83
MTLGGLSGAVLLLFALVVGPWLLTRHPQQGLTAEQELKAKNDVRATLVQALAGLAVAGGLVVTYRTFQHNRIEQDRNYQLRQAEQVNEFYAKAVEQLGHEEAPVRLGALYSLARLAQANPHQRQTVVDVMCAYLRMPYAPPGAPKSFSAAKRDPAQELQVRLTAQRLLADHLRVPLGVSDKDAQEVPPTPDESFWPGISLDLTGAVLINFSLNEASIQSAAFMEATFSGLAMFDGVTFTANVVFSDATFTDNATFYNAAFNGAAWFRDTSFNGKWSFFGGATFAGGAAFTDATFAGEATFGGATFTGATGYTGAAEFHRATFSRDADFGHATFANAWFSEAIFSGDARFTRATFQGNAGFGGATFSSTPLCDAAQVLHLDDPDLNKGGNDARRVWPNGWTVRPNADDPTRGTLVSSPKGVPV